MTDEAKATSNHILTAQTLATSVVSIRQPKNVQWTPQEDITAYELALCLPVITSPNIWYREDYIPKGCERHFKVTDR